jgi:hypothetical protein
MTPNSTENKSAKFICCHDKGCVSLTHSVNIVTLTWTKIVFTTKFETQTSKLTHRSFGTVGLTGQPSFKTNYAAASQRNAQRAAASRRIQILSMLRIQQTSQFCIQASLLG